MAEQTSDETCRAFNVISLPFSLETAVPPDFITFAPLISKPSTLPLLMKKSGFTQGLSWALHL